MLLGHTYRLQSTDHKVFQLMTVIEPGRVVDNMCDQYTDTPTKWETYMEFSRLLSPHVTNHGGARCDCVSRHLDSAQLCEMAT